MKIGILTLSASYNCGSMLQSYALKEKLKKYGDVEIINFSSAASHAMYDLLPKSLIRRLKMKYKQKNIFRELRIETQAYIKFQKDKLGIKGREFFLNDLEQISNKYDVVVVGSDQVWNVCMNDFDEAFFCSWTNAKKVAYAPSLGGHDIRESDNAPQYIESIKTFSALSVRESVGKECLESILKTNVKKVLDPTLILNVERWVEMIGEPLIQGDYIFYYSWSYGNKELRSIVAERSKNIGIPVYVIDAHKWQYHRTYTEGFKLCNEAGPLAFLNLMYYAKECYVESFHGMLFAYMFKKNFWLLDNHEEYEDLDSRLKELVELLSAKDRILTKYNNLTVDKSVPFKYEENILLKKMKEDSEMYLEEAFQKI